MNKGIIARVESAKYVFTVEEHTSRFGKGIKISISDKSLKSINTITYSCHSDFESYNDCQNKSLQQLSDIALERIHDDMKTKDFILATEHGIGLLLPINK